MLKFTLNCLYRLAECKAEVLLPLRASTCKAPFFFSFTCHLWFLFISAASVGSEDCSSILTPSLVRKSSPLSVGIWMFFFLFLSFTFLLVSLYLFSQIHWLLSSGWWHCYLYGGRGCTSPQQQWIFPIICLSPPPPFFLALPLQDCQTHPSPSPFQR